MTDNGKRSGWATARDAAIAAAQYLRAKYMRERVTGKEKLNEVGVVVFDFGDGSFGFGSDQFGNASEITFSPKSFSEYGFGKAVALVHTHPNLTHILGLSPQDFILGEGARNIVGGGVTVWVIDRAGDLHFQPFDGRPYDPSDGGTNFGPAGTWTPEEAKWAETPDGPRGGPRILFPLPGGAPRNPGKSPGGRGPGAPPGGSGRGHPAEGGDIGSGRDRNVGPPAGPSGGSHASGAGEAPSHGGGNGGNTTPTSTTTTPTAPPEAPSGGGGGGGGGSGQWVPKEVAGVTGTTKQADGTTVTVGAQQNTQTGDIQYTTTIVSPDGRVDQHNNTPAGAPNNKSEEKSGGAAPKPEPPKEDPPATDHAPYVNPDADDYGTTHQPPEDILYVPSVREKGVNALLNMLAGVKPSGPKPRGPGPTDSDDWNPFGSARMASAPPETRGGHAQRAESWAGLVAGRGRMDGLGPTDTGDQVPLLHGRATGGESSGTNVLSVQDAIWRQMVWDTKVAPIINVARATSSATTARLRRVGRG